MPVATTNNRIQYTGDAATVAFAFSFPVTGEGDLEVYVDETLQTITSDYTVAATNNDYASGGTVTFLSAPANNTKITISRAIALTSSLDLTTGDTVPANDLEDAINRLTMQVQLLQDQVDRCIKIPVTDPTTLDLELVSQSNRTEDNGILFNASGEPVVGTLISSSAATAFVATLLDDSDADEFLATLGATATAATTATVLGLRHQILSKSADYTILDTDVASEVLVLVTTGASNITITLPTAADSTGKRVVVSKVDSGAGYVIVDGEGAETINGSTTVRLIGQDATAAFVGDGSGWVSEFPTVAGIIQIGDWNMSATGSWTASVAHNLADHTDIRSCQGVIFEDGAVAAIHPIGGFSRAGAEATTADCDAWLYLDSTNVVLQRRDSSNYDSATFDATSYNRGFLRLEYSIR